MPHDDPPRRHLHPVEPPYDPEYDNGRPVHQNHAAEQAVLGALLLAPELAEELQPHLEPDDFYRPAHEMVWNAIHHVAQHEAVLPDPITVADHLTKTGELTKIGGAPYLHDLMAACPLPRQAETYAAKVRDAARLRRLQDTTTRLQAVVNSGTTDELEQTFTRFYEELDEAAARIGPTTATTTPTATGLRDLSWILTGEPPATTPPAWVHRTDGTALFYAGHVNGIFGDPEAAKTWLAQVAIVEALNAGQTAAMIDVDHNGMDHTAARLLLLGARLDHLADPERFRYYEPEDADQLRAAVTDITNRAPAVVLIDSIGEIFPMLGVKSTDNDEITAALRLVCSPPARAGSCVITIDHLPKSAEARATGFAIGGTAKKRAMDGAYLRAEAKTQPAPGQVGRITLRIEKDRLGELRKACGGGYVGTFVLDSTQPHVTTATINGEDSPITSDGKFRPTHLMEAVSRFVEDSDLDPSGKQIEAGVRGGSKPIRAAIRCLLDEGFLTPVAGRYGQVYHSAIHYREDEDGQK